MNRGQQFDQTLPQLLFDFQLTLPYHQRSPPKLCESQKISPVSDDISLELFAPEKLIVGRKRAVFAADVPMPEATVDEDRRKVERGRTAPFDIEKIWLQESATGQEALHARDLPTSRRSNRIPLVVTEESFVG